MWPSHFWPIPAILRQQHISVNMFLLYIVFFLKEKFCKNQALFAVK